MKPAPETQTIYITNFSGRLTRILNGDLNSGFARFSTSFGYDPFTKPMNLTWLETPTSITGITSLPQAGKVTADTTQGPNVHVITQNGNWYQIRSATTGNSNLNSVIGIASVSTQNYTFGTSMEFFGSIVGGDISGVSLPRLYVGGDTRVVSANPDGSAEAAVGTVANYTSAIFRPLKIFAGTLIFGNGATFGQINATNTVISSVLNIGTGNTYSAINPGLGAQARLMDIEVSPSNNYITLATANLRASETLDSANSDFGEAFASLEGRLFEWNGTDATVTAAKSVPSYKPSALETYFDRTMFFATDTFGTAFNDGAGKILTLPNNRTPMPNAVSVNGNFMTWACPEINGTARYMSLYYYGSLDQENPPGLYRVLRWTTTQSSGFVNRVPLNILVSNYYQTVNAAGTALITFGFGKHYIGLNSRNDSATANYLLSFLITPTTTGTPQLGVYETQTQLFSKRVAVKAIRVYTEPAVTGNGFQLDIIGSDGAIVANGTYTYTFADVADPQSGSTAVERINFNVNPKTQYALGVRVTNTGTVNMTIKKIEIDIIESGK